MEYHKGFLQQRYSDLRPEDSGITRKQYLMSSFKTNQFLRDVVEVTVALPEPQLSRFLVELKTIDYGIKDVKGAKECTGPEAKIVLVPSTKEALGITQLKMTLLPGKRIRSPLRFGKQSVLRQEGDLASWTF